MSDVKDLGIKVKTNADAIKATDTKVAKNLEGIATNKEAIAKNTSSIKATNDKIGNLIKSLKAPTFEGKVTANGGIAVSKEFKVSSATEVSMGGNRVQNVADAVDNTDAVNLGQLKAESSRIFSNLDKKFSASTKKLSEDLEALKKESRAGSASAMATASLPQAWTPDQIGVGLGVATYRGAFGYSLGVSAMSGDEAWVGKASVSGDSKGGFGGSLGMMFSF
ncbi:YadA-like family protein [Taylorella asinigenitalis]|uniref:YadA-like family protein n=1 Tax=Taylorella asinigenitalis TaxID=84590 RepID=UPI000A9D8E02|nr:YadA-like family protein [Taylorella asinigenitalis]